MENDTRIEMKDNVLKKPLLVSRIKSRVRENNSDFLGFLERNDFDEKGFNKKNDKNKYQDCIKIKRHNKQVKKTLNGENDIIKKWNRTYNSKNTFRKKKRKIRVDFDLKLNFKKVSDIDKKTKKQKCFIKGVLKKPKEKMVAECCIIL